MKKWSWLSDYQIGSIFKEDTSEFTELPTLAIGVMVDYSKETVFVVYADLSWKSVPFHRFKPSGTLGSAYYCEPNFKEFQVTDWGLSIRFGDYEAGVDSI